MAGCETGLHIYREFPLSLFHTLPGVWFMVLQDESRPHVAGSESDECTKYESTYPSMFHTWPDHEPDTGQSMKQTQWKCPVIQGQPTWDLTR